MIDLREVTFIPSWVIVAHQQANRGAASHYGAIGNGLLTVMIRPSPIMTKTFPELNQVEELWLAYRPKG